MLSSVDQVLAPTTHPIQLKCRNPTVGSKKHSVWVCYLFYHYFGVEFIHFFSWTSFHKPSAILDPGTELCSRIVSEYFALWVTIPILSSFYNSCNSTKLMNREYYCWYGNNSGLDSENLGTKHICYIQSISVGFLWRQYIH